MPGRFRGWINGFRYRSKSSAGPQAGTLLPRRAAKPIDAVPTSTASRYAMAVSFLKKAGSISFIGFCDGGDYRKQDLQKSPIRRPLRWPLFFRLHLGLVRSKSGPSHRTDSILPQGEKKLTRWQGAVMYTASRRAFRIPSRTPTYSAAPRAGQIAHQAVPGDRNLALIEAALHSRNGGAPGPTVNIF